jgi:hypothetical protein
VRAFLDTACGGAKISARIAVVTTHVAIAPDLSHACTLHRRACRPLLLASKRSEGGLSTARLKSGAAKSWGKTDPGRAETRRRFALARPCSMSCHTFGRRPRRRLCEVGFSPHHTLDPI